MSPKPTADKIAIGSSAVFWSVAAITKHNPKIIRHTTLLLVKLLAVAVVKTVGQTRLLSLEI
jgi:hypothetical protein